MKRCLMCRRQALPGSDYCKVHAQGQFDFEDNPPNPEPPPPFRHDTLKEARERVLDNLDEGSHCPCCDQYARRYKRTIYSSQAEQLIRLYRLCKKTEFDGRYYHRTVVVPYANNGDLVLLRHWNLLEVEPNEDPDKRESGAFRITELGRAFVELKARVPKACYQYNDTIHGWTERTTTIKEALGTRFSYEELMRGET